MKKKSLKICCVLVASSGAAGACTATQQPAGAQAEDEAGGTIYTGTGGALPTGGASIVGMTLDPQIGTGGFIPGTGGFALGTGGGWEIGTGGAMPTGGIMGDDDGGLAGDDTLSDDDSGVGN